MITKAETDCSCNCGLNITPQLLERLNAFREDFGLPMVVSSGARCLAVNTKAGGKPASAHLEGRAIDFVRTEELEAFCSVKNLVKFDLHMEHKDFCPSWIHLSDRPPPSKKRIFKP